MKQVFCQFFFGVQIVVESKLCFPSSHNVIDSGRYVQHRITYKLAVLTYKVQTTSTPAYLSRHIRLRDSVRTLRLTKTTRFSKSFASTAFAKRAFRCSAPATWNSLPRTVTTTH